VQLRPSKPPPQPSLPAQLRLALVSSPRLTRAVENPLLTPRPPPPRLTPPRQRPWPACGRTSSCCGSEARGAVERLATNHPHPHPHTPAHAPATEAPALCSAASDLYCYYLHTSTLCSFESRRRSRRDQIGEAQTGRQWRFLLVTEAGGAVKSIAVAGLEVQGVDLATKEGLKASISPSPVVRSTASSSTPKHVLGPVPGVDVMAKRSQGWVKCEDRLPYYKGSSYSLSLLVTTPRLRLHDSRGPRRGRPGPSARSSGALGASTQREGAVPDSFGQQQKMTRASHL
jgi:hypothetical protein